MAIVNMSKFDLFIFKDQRENFLKKIQKFKYVHLVNHERKDEDEELSEVSRANELMEIDDKISKAKEAIEILEKYKKKKSALKAMKEGKENLTFDELLKRAGVFDFEKYYGEVSKIKKDNDDILAELTDLDQKIFDLNPWKSIDFPLEKLDAFKDVSVYTGTIPDRYRAEFENSLKNNDLIYIDKVHVDKNYSYYLIICHKSEDEKCNEVFRKMGFTISNFKDAGKAEDLIKSYKDKKEDNKKKIQENVDKLKTYVKFLDDFQIYYEYLRNEKLKTISSQKFLDTKNLDLIEGYVPRDMLGNFEKLVKDLVGENYYFVSKDAERDSKEVPIMLKNNKLIRPFEFMTEMYSLPKYNEIDPTPFFAPFYFIFAGIMVGDLGYGLLVFIGSLIALKSFNLDKGQRKFIQFFNYLSISTMIFGLIFGSFFGGIIKLPSLIDPAADTTEMLLLSLLLGGIHIFFALGINGYMKIRDGHPKDAFFDVGLWYMVLVGSIGFGISKVITMNPLVSKILFWTMIVSMIGIVLTGGRDQKSLGGKFGWGIYSLYGITSYIGDFVSYLRLMALVLSGSFIGVAVNMVAGMLFGSSIFGKIFAVLIFLVFQAFNAFLSYLSAYVHTARLTYVEMFNKFYEGGGRPFKKMIEDSKYFNIE
ncbi:V-type ATP synthase subunit I [Peptoniphilus raoultii]|uniref:V-type ATP synthase subunit I n=1 Tax=Peptoniphilus raoultii TaxID=1776387 RepID=UPI0008D9A57C|nr:V-type ATP synthase subunit I [Peptoniphilus raoultii]